MCTGSEALVCEGTVAHQCEGGRAVGSEDCAARGLRCVPRLGCRTCVPNEVGCEGERTRVCAPDGSAWMDGVSCDRASGERCSRRGCARLCEQAAAERSYLGCEYWPVVTRNAQLDPEFAFAVVVGNPQLVEVELEITGPGIEPIRRRLAPGAVEPIELPWVEPLRGRMERPESAIVRGGAYRLVTDAPVVVHQFNPLEYELPRDCTVEQGGPPDDGRCHSFSNDASLLLPTHALGTSYLAISRPTLLLEVHRGPEWVRGASPGLLAVVAIRDGTEVELTASAHVAAASDGSWPALAPGGHHRVTLDRGDVLQVLSAVPDGCPGETFVERTPAGTFVYCDTPRAWDLTGTIVRASAPVAVISGHDCAFVPYQRFACDHLEEQMLPVEAWGREAVFSATRPLRGEPNLVRIVSAADGNEVRIEGDERPPTVLHRGEWLELQTYGDGRVRGTGPLAVVQFMVGQDFLGRGSSGPGAMGDPSMGLVAPAEQWRASYDLLVPRSFPESWITLVAPAAARIELDGTTLREARSVGDGSLVTMRARLSGGVHRLEGTLPFGTLVYGFGAYTSYLVPGGLDVRLLEPPI